MRDLRDRTVGLIPMVYVCGIFHRRRMELDSKVFGCFLVALHHVMRTCMEK
jgi:hypothetical protein